MAQHVEINPDNESFAVSLGEGRTLGVNAEDAQDRYRADSTSTGKDFIAGKGAEDGAN